MIYELNLDDKIEVSKIKKFLSDNSDSDYMQSIEWNIIRNEKTKYFIYYVENEEIIWSCNLLEKEKNNVKYLYAPRGPVLKNSNFDLINLFLKNIKEWLSIKKYTTLVINPYINEINLKKISNEYNYRITQNNDYSNLEKNVIDSMVELGRKYPKCGYGPSFRHWIMSDEHKPYGSFGNGAAMRISSVGVVAKDINEIKRLSAIITNVSHNHKDSIDGSEATAVAIHMALNGKSKDEIKEYINNNYFGIYDLRKDSMKPQIFHINYVETVKQSIGAFLDSNDFEDAIRNAIVLGGDSDTIAAITGGIAAAYYGIPDNIYNKALEYLDDYLIEIHDCFYKKYEVIK